MTHPIIETVRAGVSDDVVVSLCGTGHHGWLQGRRPAFEAGETYFEKRDGSDVAAWLTAHGYEVAGHKCCRKLPLCHSVFGEGVAWTTCGIEVRSTGAVCFKHEA